MSCVTTALLAAERQLRQPTDNDEECELNRDENEVDCPGFSSVSPAIANYSIAANNDAQITGLLGNQLQL